MAAGTSLNESLTCVGIAFVGKYPKATYAEFIDMFYNPKDRRFSGVIKNCQTQFKNKTDYTNNYPRPSQVNVSNETVDNWFAISYFTGRALGKNIGVKLDRYDVLRLSKSDSTKGYFLESQSVSAITKQYKKLGGTGYAGKVNKEKVMIADIILYARTSKLENKLRNHIANGNLTLTSYKTLFNEEFKKKSVIPVSLKAINTKNPKVKFINAPSSITLKKDVQDEFHEELLILSRLAKNTNKKLFLDRVDKILEIVYPVNFDGDSTRVWVHFNFKFRDGKTRRYGLWTNYSKSGPSIHISDLASQSASGEGGLTSSYFEEMSKDYPQLRQFFKHLKKKRMGVLEKIISPDNIDKFMDVVKKQNPKVLSFNDSSLNSKFYPLGVSAYSTFLKTLTDLGRQDIADDFFEQYSYELTNKRDKKYDPRDVHSGHELSGYEVGYFFSENQSLVREILKKQILMSWYAAVSGRGFIVVNRKKFAANQFYKDEMDQPPAYIKVGF
tara:strand:+ start:613 stop:2106 length:1494 start_codon:yes stop_codon:yes gene_type:complete